MLSMKIYIIIYYLSHNILTYHYKVIKMDNELLNEIHMVKNHSKGTKKLYILTSNNMDKERND